MSPAASRSGHSAASCDHTSAFYVDIGRMTIERQKAARYSDYYLCLYTLFCLALP
jgi:predicted RNA-binding protein associated with RNAse of E/G family